MIGIPEPRRRDLISLLVIALTSILAFANSLHNDFVRDDLPIILANPMVHSWKELPNLLVSDYWASMVRITDKLYRPLLMVSYLVNYSIGGTDSFGYHLFNLTLHIEQAMTTSPVACGTPERMAAPFPRL